MGFPLKKLFKVIKTVSDVVDIFKNLDQRRRR